jgi:hypothetical protein
MMKGMVKAAVALAIGMLTTATGCVFVDMHHWPQRSKPMARHDVESAK